MVVKNTAIQKICQVDPIDKPTCVLNVETTINVRQVESSRGCFVYRTKKLILSQLYKY